LHKLLIANRGEIAVRIVRACRDLGLATVAVYSEADRDALHVRMADEACAIGPGPAAGSYLRIDRILAAARASGADAVHPGYGFLSENAAFAAACRDAALTFVGPPADAIALMGRKTAARRAALAAGVPVVPGTEEALGDDVPERRIAELADELGYPLIVKAVAGGGGKGMRVVYGRAELADAVRAARSEGRSAFGDPAIYLERRLEQPRHIEVQLLADAYGTVLPFVERECSIQRRHQKLVEETPSPAVSPELREALTGAAASVARAAGYTNAGTIEFLLDAAGRFYFLEMNTRLQVEHPITEAVTGVDLVAWQIRIAAGERLSLDPGQLLTPRGHAIECRIYAEDAASGFLPSPGRITGLRMPAGPGIRVDGGAETGADVSVFYDPLISKLIAWGEDRGQAVSRMRRALRECEIRGIQTTVPFFTWLLQEPSFLEAAFHTGYLEEVLQRQAGEPRVAADMSFEDVAAMAGALVLTLNGGTHGGEPARARAEAAGVSWRDRPAPAAARTASRWARRARLDALRT
jgi:acetyl-CoA carboxylase biotin carboxylase subunit